MSDVPTINIGLCGFGTVGQGVWKHLTANRAELEARVGVKLNLARVAVRDARKRRTVKIPRRCLTEDAKHRVLAAVSTNVSRIAP